MLTSGTFTPSLAVWFSKREAKPDVGQTFSFWSAERLNFRWKREAQLLRTTEAFRSGHPYIAEAS